MRIIKRPRLVTISGAFTCHASPTGVSWARVTLFDLIFLDAQKSSAANYREVAFPEGGVRVDQPSPGAWAAGQSGTYLVTLTLADLISIDEPEGDSVHLCIPPGTGISASITSGGGTASASVASTASIHILNNGVCAEMLGRSTPTTGAVPWDTSIAISGSIVNLYGGGETTPISAPYSSSAAWDRGVSGGTGLPLGFGTYTIDISTGLSADGHSASMRWEKAVTFQTEGQFLTDSGVLPTGAGSPTLKALHKTTIGNPTTPTQITGNSFTRTDIYERYRIDGLYSSAPGSIPLDGLIGQTHNGASTLLSPSIAYDGDSASFLAAAEFYGGVSEGGLGTIEGMPYTPFSLDLAATYPIGSTASLTGWTGIGGTGLTIDSSSPPIGSAPTPIGGVRTNGATSVSFFSTDYSAENPYRYMEFIIETIAGGASGELWINDGSFGDKKYPLALGAVGTLATIRVDLFKPRNSPVRWEMYSHGQAVGWLAGTSTANFSLKFGAGSDYIIRAVRMVRVEPLKWSAQTTLERYDLDKKRPFLVCECDGKPVFVATDRAPLTLTIRQAIDSPLLGPTEAGYFTAASPKFPGAWTKTIVRDGTTGTTYSEERNLSTIRPGNELLGAGFADGLQRQWYKDVPTCYTHVKTLTAYSGAGDIWRGNNTYGDILVKAWWHLHGTLVGIDLNGGTPLAWQLDPSGTNVGNAVYTTAAEGYFRTEQPHVKPRATDPDPSKRHFQLATRDVIGGVIRGHAVIGFERGWTRVHFWLPVVSGLWLWADVSATNRYVRSFNTSDGSIALEFENRSTIPATWQEVGTGMVGTKPIALWDRSAGDGGIVLSYEHDGGIYERRTRDEGRIWTQGTTEMIITSAGAYHVSCITETGMRHYFWIDGGAIKTTALDGSDSVRIAEAVAVASGVAGGIALAQLGCHEDRDTREIVLHYTDISGARVALKSINGVTFA